ncbi:MAG: hypothetical protein P8016_17425 [Sedimentisphaerales bacterium]
MTNSFNYFNFAKKLIQLQRDEISYHQDKIHVENNRHEVAYFSVSFNIKSYGFSWDTICVQFHSTPKIDGITIRSIDVIGIAIQRYTIYLEKVKSDFRTIDKENLKKEKHERIKAIKRELSELEQGGQNEHSTAKNS